MYIVHVVLLQFSIAGYIYLTTMNKWLFMLVFMPIFFILCLFSYWVYTQDISVTNSLIHAVIETKPSIVVDLLSFPYLMFMLLLVALLVVIGWVFKKIPFKGNLPFFTITLASISTFFLIENIRPNTLKSRLPYSVIYGVTEYYKKVDYVFNLVPETITALKDSLNIVLVLGESVRADHLQLNGYAKETTPYLVRNKNVVSYSNIYTPHTYTGSSLPRILTDASVDTNNLNNITSIFDVFNRSGYYTIWIGNQELEKSYKSIVDTNNKVLLIDSLRSVYSFRKALDEQLLKPFKNSVNEAKARGLYTLHMMGSHWWYENRYPESIRQFRPVINSKHIPSLNGENIINSYDNTIVYLDHLINEIIKILQDCNVPTILIYLSDHGEILGENGKWLHAQNDEASRNPAMFVWYSNRFKEIYPLKVEALSNNNYNHYTTDILYYSLLDLIEIKGLNYDNTQSIFTKK